MMKTLIVLRDGVITEVLTDEQCHVGILDCSTGHDPLFKPFESSVISDSLIDSVIDNSIVKKVEEKCHQLDVYEVLEMIANGN
jgi:hypothetical protein